MSALDENDDNEVGEAGVAMATITGTRSPTDVGGGAVVGIVRSNNPIWSKSSGQGLGHSGGGEVGGGSDPIKRPVHSSLTMVFWWWGDLLWGDLLELGRPPRTPLVPHCSARRCM